MNHLLIALHLAVAAAVAGLAGRRWSPGLSVLAGSFLLMALHQIVHTWNVTKPSSLVVILDTLDVGVMIALAWVFINAETRNLDTLAALKKQTGEQEQILVDLRQAQADLEAMARFPNEDPMPVMRFDAQGELLYANITGQRFVNEHRGHTMNAELPEVLAECFSTNAMVFRECAFAGGVYRLAFVPTGTEVAPEVNVYGFNITAQVLAQEEVEQRRRELQCLVDIALILAAPEPFEDKTRNTLDAMVRLCGGDMGTLRTYDADRQKMVILGTSSPSPSGHVMVPEVGVDSYAYKAYRAGQTYLSQDFQNDLEGDEASKLMGIRSVVILPLKWDDRVIGTASITAVAVNHFNDDTVRILSAVAGQSGLLLESARLQTELAERTELLFKREAQLLQAQKLEALGQLAGVVAHDTNNMLSVILGCCDELQRSPSFDPNTMQRLLGHMYQACRKSAAMVQRLLAFSSSQNMRPTPVYLHVMFDEISGVMRRLAGSARLILDLDPETPAVYLDQGHFEQAVFNLVINARDAIEDEEGAIIRISTHPLVIDNGEGERLGLERGTYAVLAVRDNGHGIPPHLASRVLEPFFTTKEQGTGLGLSTAYGVLAQLGGALDIESPLPCGRGTEIRLYVPAGDSSGVAYQEVETPVITIPPGSLALVVDDEPVILESLTTSLEALGFDILTAFSGEQALAVLDQTIEPLALLITDIRMPGIRGDALAPMIRERFPSMPVLFVSGWEQPSESLPRAGFLRKPFTVRQLQSKLMEIFGNQSDKAHAV